MMSMGATIRNGGQRNGEWRWLCAVARKNGDGGCCKEDEDGGFCIVFLQKKVMRELALKTKPETQKCQGSNQNNVLNVGKGVDSSPISFNLTE
ncbi:hypothetical protein TIFTF001_022081 [Ficus carica]|uniref:Uncharacterized protein n=1 Tax=Ficus carica TaxID=3494 RepID=A0AA88AH41_FICCA|nr:hypothetical protein TIFTF001_022081 [Ficus carica]